VISVAEPNGHDDLGGDALGRLSDSDRVRFERHLDACDDCRSELRLLEAAARLLPLAAPDAEPPVGLEGRVFVAVERAAREAAQARPGATAARGRPRRRRLWRPLAAAVAAAAVAVLALVLSTRPDGAAHELRTTLSAPGGGTARAAVEVRKTGIGRVIAFRSDSLPILPKGDYYELWFAAPGDAPGRPNRISAGTFHPDARGRSRVRFAAAVDPALYPVLIVTAEPGDGDPRATGPEVLRSVARP
jgi:anti-sigma-K factor RskA